MNPRSLVVMAMVAGLCLAGTNARATQCFRVNPKAPGWKYVNVPAGYTFGPAVEQFRPGADVILFEAWPVGQRIIYGQSKHGWHHQATLHLDQPGYQSIRLEFSPPLDRRKIEVLGYAYSGFPFTIREKSRHSGRLLDLELPDRQISKLKIFFHSHFRKPPDISQVWLGRPHTLDSQVVPEKLWDQELLFFRSLDGSPLTLCNTVGGLYQVFAEPLVHKPEKVTLSESFERHPGSHRRWIGAVVAGSLIGLIIFAAVFALKPAGKDGPKDREGKTCADATGSSQDR